MLIKMKLFCPVINNDWDIILKDEIQNKSFEKLISLIARERKINNIFPEENSVFNALKLSPFSKTKIVIVGQDPYHKIGLAHGLCFSVPNGKKIPPSLQNIFKELQADLNIPATRNGNLESWANQGVLLLNSILTVRENEAGSHQALGWEKFTDAIISKLSRNKKGLIFLLWGSYAQSKSSLINEQKHTILQTSHPSPLSAYRGFIGCKHFSKTNKILKKNNQKPINWKLCADSLTLF